MREISGSLVAKCSTMLNTSQLLTLVIVTWCLAGSARLVYQSFFTKNRFLLLMGTTLMRAVRLNHNNELRDAELRGVCDNNSLWVCYYKYLLTNTVMYDVCCHFIHCQYKNIDQYSLKYKIWLKPTLCASALSLKHISVLPFPVQSLKSSKMTPQCGC